LSIETVTRAHVLELVLEFDFFGDRDAVLGDGGSPYLSILQHLAVAARGLKSSEKLR
jgi:hypothetical protein